MQETVLVPRESHPATGSLKHGKPVSWPTPVVFTTSILAASFIFVLFPPLDLTISRFFADAQSFPLSENPFLKAIRDLNRHWLTYLLPFLLLTISFHALLPRKWTFCPPHKALFVLLSFLFGPLLTVHFLKNTIGRARPRDLIEFGGTADFTPVWQYAAVCGRSCSFPSGEAATAAATLSLVVFIPERWRPTAIALAIPVLFFISFNRVLFGAHFLSDVIVAWGIALCFMVLLWQRISSHAAAIDDNVRGFRTHLSRRRAARRSRSNSPLNLDKADENPSRTLPAATDNNHARRTNSHFRTGNKGASRKSLQQ